MKWRHGPLAKHGLDTQCCVGTRLRAVLTAALCAMPALTIGSIAGHALTIELKDVAADRIERQRAAAAGALPLAGTPNVAVLDERLLDTGVNRGAHMLIRVFKAESELEVWKERGDKYVLFATYPICHWSGSLGPKLLQGDKQTPEGFYTVSRAQTRGSARWPRSLNIGYPNVFDQSLGRTGSHILVHGGCSSIGCFAMTNAVMDEIYELTTAAITGGQEHVPVHVFPFRMTPINILKNVQSPWLDAWKNLKEGYDLFEKTRRPPSVSICDSRYEFRPTTAGEVAGDLNACPSTLMAIRDQSRSPKATPPPSADDDTATPAGRGRGASLSKPSSRSKRKNAAANVGGVRIRCSMRRPSCRKFVALQRRIASRRSGRRVVAEQRPPQRPTRYHFGNDPIVVSSGS